MKSCEKCGSANHDTADFCGLCMTSFVPDDQPAMQAAPGVPKPETQPPTEPAGPPDPIRPGLPSTVQDASEALSERPVDLRSSMEIFNDAFFFWWDNALVYLLVGLALTGAAWFIPNGLFFSATDAASVGASGTASLRTADNLWFGISKADLGMAVVYLITYSILMTTTVKNAQGHKAGVFPAIVEGIVNLKSLLWLMIPQALATAILLLPTSALIALVFKSTAPGKMLHLLIGGLIVVVVSAPFIISMFVFLDQDLKGRKAFSAGIYLIRRDWGGVVWRFLVFGLFITFMNIGSKVHPAIVGISLIFAPGIMMVYPWFVYADLKKVQEARERKSLVPESLANI